MHAIRRIVGKLETRRNSDNIVVVRASVAENAYMSVNRRSHEAGKMTTWQTLGNIWEFHYAILRTDTT